MATVAQPAFETGRRPDVFSGTPRAHAVDRWIYVFTAASFIVICLAGFIPDSLMKIEMVRAGQRPPFPLVLHAHAVLMGSFLVLLLGQTWMMATGRRALHMKLGVLGAILAVALIIVGFMLVYTNYHILFGATQSADPKVSEGAAIGLNIWENIMLLQIRIGILFALFLLLLHIIEIFLFAFFYLATGDAKSLHQAIYHSGLAYTTMGVVDGGFTKWMVLSTFEGLVGFLMIGWSSAVFVSEMDRLLRNKRS